MSSAKSAVSDYEFLNHKHHVLGNTIGINESDDDELFLKAPKSKTLVDPLASFLNSNNNYNSSSIIQALKSNDNLDYFQSVNSIIPQPYSWSTGMTVESNPALLITPEKSVKITASNGSVEEKDHLLESRQAPEPVPWSPGMRPEKSVFITPDKAINRNNIDGFKKEFPCSSTSRSTNLIGTEKSGKEKQTVRFDIPSLSSGDDTFFDENSCLFGSVTIEGKELTSPDAFEESSGMESLDFKERSFEGKSYNPNLYSDDSAMDESTLISKTDGLQKPESQCRQSDITLSTSSNLVNKLRELMQETDSPQTVVSAVKENKQPMFDSSLHTTQSIKAKSSKGSRKAVRGSSDTIIPSKNKDPYSSDVTVIKVNQGKPNAPSSHSQTKSGIKAGPHFLRDPISAYHPPSTGSCIVKEPHHQTEFQRYSYPFQNKMEDQCDNETEEHAFARPEFNSTLKFRQELDNICDQEINIVDAVNEKLKLTSERRTEIQEKAATLTNCPSDQFSNLVDLDPPIDRLCDRIVKMRTTKVVKKKKVSSEKGPKTSANVPDLMEFYSPDLQKETPSFVLHGISPTISNLRTASNDHAFDIYRHNRVWEGIHDF